MAQIKWLGTCGCYSCSRTYMFMFECIVNGTSLQPCNAMCSWRPEAEMLLLLVTARMMSEQRGTVHLGPHCLQTHDKVS